MDDQSVLSSIREASANIQRLAEQLNRKEIDPAAAIEMFQKEISKLEPILKPLDQPGVLWPTEIREFILSVHNSGIKVPFIEEMLRRQDISD